MKRKHFGNEPKHGELVSSNRGWLLFDVSKKSGGWSALKLVSVVERSKGNFHLAWNADQSRLAMGRDAILLNEHYPEVFDWVTSTMELIP